MPNSDTRRAAYLLFLSFGSGDVHKHLPEQKQEAGEAEEHQQRKADELWLALRRFAAAPGLRHSPLKNIIAPIIAGTPVV